MSSRCTLLVDGNWLLISRASTLLKQFEINNRDIVLEEAEKDLIDLLAKSVNIILNRFPVIDNIIMITDGGSWRKQLPIPKSLNAIYKGNRETESTHDWPRIFKCLNKLRENCEEIGMTTCHHNMIEGDDWIWYWSRRLNSEGTNCIIWSADNDLKQLVQIDKDTQALSMWYNDNYGLWLPKQLEIPEQDSIDFFMNPIYISPILDSIKMRVKKSVNYIDPEEIVNSKIMCGDNSDNIKSVIRYEKNGRTYRLSEKDWKELSDSINIRKVKDLRNNIDSIIKALVNHKKFIKYNVPYSDVKEMIDYNTKLVWLNEGVIPGTITNAMNNVEYKEFDVSYIKSNYKTLSKDEENIENIFDNINF